MALENHQNNHAYRLSSTAIQKAEKLTLITTKDAIREEDIRNLGYARVLYEQAKVAKKAGNLHCALERSVKAMKIVARVRGSNSIDYARCANLVARVHCALHSFNDAESILESIRLPINIFSMSPKEIIVFDGVDCNLALAKQHLGKHIESEFLYKSVLERHSEAKNSPAYALVQISLGSLYLDMKEIEQASRCISEGANVIEEMRQDRSEYRIASICALGRLEQARKSYGPAESMFLKALRLSKQTKKNPSLGHAQIESRLASLYEEIGKHTKAVDLWQSVLATREKLLGSEHFLTTETRMEIRKATDIQKLNNEEPSSEE